MRERCVNHPDEPALSICHACNRYFCQACLTPGPTYYYCTAPECQRAFRKEALPPKLSCPVCAEELLLTRTEQESKEFWCPGCHNTVNLSSDTGDLTHYELNVPAQAVPAEYSPSHALFKTLTYFLIAGMIVHFFAVLSDYREIAFVGRIGNGVSVSHDEIAQNDTRQQIFGIIKLGVYGTAFVFLFWFYLAYRNVRSFGARNLRYSPRWALWGFFVPVLNLVRPFQVGREIWNASEPEAVDSISWKQLGTPPEVSLWWGSYVVWNVVSQIARRVMPATPSNITDILNGCWANAAADILGIPAAIFALRFVFGVQLRQSKKHEKLVLPDSAEQTEQIVHYEGIEPLGSPALMTSPDLGQPPVRLGLVESVSLERVKKLCRWLLVGHRYVILTPLVVFLPVLNLPRILGILFAERRYSWILLFLVMMLASIGTAYILYSSTRSAAYLWCLPGLSFVLYCLLLRIAAGRWLWDLTGAGAETPDDD